jgi:hypothetical protein
MDAQLEVELQKYVSPPAVEAAPPVPTAYVIVLPGVSVGLVIAEYAPPPPPLVEAPPPPPMTWIVPLAEFQLEGTVQLVPEVK